MIVTRWMCYTPVQLTTVSNTPLLVSENQTELVSICKFLWADIYETVWRWSRSDYFSSNRYSSTFFLPCAVEIHVTFTSSSLQSLLFLVRDWNYPYEYDYGVAGGQRILDRTLDVSLGGHLSWAQIYSIFQNCGCSRFHRFPHYVCINNSRHVLHCTTPLSKIPHCVLEAGSHMHDSVYNLTVNCTCTVSWSWMLSRVE